MKKMIAAILCFAFVLTLFSVSFSEANDIESGEIKSKASDLGVSADFLFKKGSNRALAVVSLICDLSDKLGKGPLDAGKVFAPVKSSCWIGITENGKNLIVISPYGEENSILFIDYNPKGIIKYKVQNNHSEDKDLTKQLPSLFAEYNSSEYYEITGEEIINAFKQIGITITVNNV